ncbi:MAG: hypothetical protein FWF60_05200, partial [Oscillospiraceae bacterium]|nr:hypothetical protein [Oscillospiraceae bacterium]
PYPQQPYPQQAYPPQYPQGYAYPPPPPPPPVEDVPNTGLNVLSFFVPIAGIIIYATSYQQTPVKAKAALKMAIISMCVAAGIAILATVLAVVAGLGAAGLASSLM